MISRHCHCCNLRGLVFLKRLLSSGSNNYNINSYSCLSEFKVQLIATMFLFLAITPNVGVITINKEIEI